MTEYRNISDNLVQVLEGISLSQCFVEIGNVFKKLKVTRRQNEGRKGGIFTSSSAMELNNRCVE